METVTKNAAEESELYAREAIRVEGIGITTNLLLFVFKLAAGILGHSGAMISDAIHTASDVFADLIAIIGLQISKKDSDEEHPYGHEKVECIFTCILGIVLLVVGLEVGKSAAEGIYGFLRGEADAIPQPGMIAITAAVVSILSKEALFRYVIQRSKKLNSPTLKATAWHHRSDALSSIGALIGIAGARMGITVLDAIASLIICVIVVKIGVEVLITSVKNLIDTALPKEETDRIREMTAEVDGVQRVVNVKTRMFGHAVYCEVTIACDGNLRLTEAHAIADAVHDTLEANVQNLKHAFVHVDPA